MDGAVLGDQEVVRSGEALDRSLDRVDRVRCDRQDVGPGRAVRACGLDRDDPGQPTQARGDIGRGPGPSERDPKLVPGEAAEEVRRRRGSDEASTVEDRDVVADPLDVLEDVGRVEDRGVVLELLQQVERGLAADGIERADGLVQQEHGRATDQRLGDPEPLAHPAGVGPGPPLGRIGQADEVEEAGDAGFDRVLDPWVERCRVAERLAPGHPVVETGLLSEEADRALIGLTGLE